MEKVIFIKSENIECKEIPIRLTCRKQAGGWKALNDYEKKRYLSKAKKIIYLGYCRQDGDMFAIYTYDQYIMIFKGILNFNSVNQTSNKLDPYNEDDWDLE